MTVNVLNDELIIPQRPRSSPASDHFSDYVAMEETNNAVLISLSISPQDFYGSSYNPVIDVARSVPSSAIFHNSAHSSRLVIYGRDPGPLPESRSLDGSSRVSTTEAATVNFLSSYYEKSWNARVARA